jgi:hypothetical protein
MQAEVSGMRDSAWWWWWWWWRLGGIGDENGPIKTYMPLMNDIVMNTTLDSKGRGTHNPMKSHHEVDHGGVDGVGDAELQLVVHLDLPRRPAHHHSLALRQRGG